MARAIAGALPGAKRRVGNHIECSTGDVVAWCAGHVLALAPPEDYSESWRAWAFETLPILPDHWRHRISSPELVESIGRLLPQASCVVHAGDPDREGQLLVDEVLVHLGWRGPTKRLLVTDLSPAAVHRALDALEPNERYRPLYEAALARQRADWLYGINLTRLYTLRARLAGYRGGVVSIGRVQTPVLGLIVRRDREIETFVAKPFYAVEGLFRTSAGEEFRGAWAVGKEHAAVTDSEGRLLSRALANTIGRKVEGQPAVVAAHDVKPNAEASPLPYSLADLQVDGGRKLGFSAARVLELAQRLYELQLLTYPRSDCTHLPEGHFEDAMGILDTISSSAPRLAEACRAADPSRRGRAWNNARITAHHAIIPTANRISAPLSAEELALYELVALRYVQQFLGQFEYLQTTATIQVAGETFAARGRQVLVLGWRAFDRQSAEPSEESESKDAERAPLPALSLGQQLLCRQAKVVPKTTKPPKPFTDATLIEAMCGVAKFVTDPRAKKILRDTDGIGTPATRASIIQVLFERTYVERRKKQIRSTPVGRALIDALPAVATTPDMTAIWEAGVRQINERQLALDRFHDAVVGQLGELVVRGKAAGPLSLPTVPVAQRPSTPRRSEGPRAASTRRQDRRAGVAR